MIETNVFNMLYARFIWVEIMNAIFKGGLKGIRVRQCTMNELAEPSRKEEKALIFRNMKRIVIERRYSPAEAIIESRDTAQEVADTILNIREDLCKEGIMLHLEFVSKTFYQNLGGYPNKCDPLPGKLMLEIIKHLAIGFQENMGRSKKGALL